MFDENNQVKVPEQMEVSKEEKKRVHITTCVRPEDDTEGKNRKTKGGG